MTGDRHQHQLSTDGDQRWLVAALTLIVIFMLGEAVVGVIAGSLALLSDAAHMLTDAVAIGLALIAVRLAARPPRGGYTFGLTRAEILSAQANGWTLVLLATWLGYEALRRLADPRTVDGVPVLVTAGIGVLVNVAAAACLARANRDSLNIQGAFQHILTDLYAFLATLVAGVVIVLTGFARADAIASMVVVLLMLRAGAGLIRQSGRILLEAAPAGTDVDAIGAELVGVASVVEVHDLHVWQITSGQSALSAHVIVADHADCHGIRTELERLVLTGHGIGHTTLQVDHQGEHATAAAGGPVVCCRQTHGPVHRADG